MAGRIIPKEKFASYQPWKMDAFERRQPFASAGDHALHSEGAGGAPQGEEASPLSDECTEQRNHETALEGYIPGYDAGQKAGYEAGYLESRDLGYQAGYESGREAGGEWAVVEVNKLKALLQGLQKELSIADQAIGNDLLMLALGLAKQMTREALRIKPELVCAAVRECLQQEPAFGQPTQLYLHPEDAALVRQYLNHELEGWTICVDSHLERGGCRVKVGHSQTDATVSTRWQRIVQALGQSGNWLE